jgi:hypothetical protein
MLIKTADDPSSLLAELAAAAAGRGPQAKRAAEDLRRIKSGLKGEAESAYLIDFEYKNSPNWAVIHDLRVEHGGRTAQIDHLLIDRLLDFYVLETKHFHAGLKITDDGEFLRWNDFKKTYEGMPSPLEQNDRHIAVLRDVIATIELPVRLGMRATTSYYSLVLVAPNARIDRPKRFDATRVIKADQLRKTIGKDIDNESAVSVLFKAATRMISSDTLEQIARRVVAKHSPLRRLTSLPIEAEVITSASEPVAQPIVVPRASSPPTPIVTEQLTCKQCQGHAGQIQYGKFGYYFQCRDCQTNTSVRFTCQPGHKPRLRKSGNDFFRDCPECGDSRLYFANV